MKTNVFNDCKDLTEVFCEYYRNAIKFDPNLPDGDAEQLSYFKKDLTAYIAEVDFSEQPKAKEELEAFPELLTELIRMEGVEMELIGSWIWLTGQTYLHKDSLKDLKLKYEPSKKAWYYRPSWSRSKNQNPLSMEQIRKMFQDPEERGFVFDNVPKSQPQAKISLQGRSLVHADR